MRALLATFTMCLIALPIQAKYSGGTGEPNDPYQIATAADLIALGETPEDYDKHFVLTADIDLDPNLPGRKVFDKAIIAPMQFASLGYGRVGTPFTGVFDGNGHTVSHLTIVGAEFLGLFGQLGEWDAPASAVTNLGVVDVNIAGSGYYVGALVGSNVSTSVTRCYSTGKVDGNDIVGGLVGANVGTTMTNCYSTGTVSGKGSVGGLVGANNVKCTVIRCYSAGAVSGENYVGGLIGTNGEPEMGRGRVMDCFWDIQTSGQATSDGGTGKTTAEMKTKSTFIDAGWDFVGETANGTEDIWWIDEGKDYPRLWWEAAGK